ncbi:hypothetical protein ABTM63_20635, partial [Acinetobacter baumannii]
MQVTHHLYGIKDALEKYGQERVVPTGPIPPESEVWAEYLQQFVAVETKFFSDTVLLSCRIKYPELFPKLLPGDEHL